MEKRKVLAAAMITAFMTTFMSSSLNLSIPSLESSFHVSAASIGWIITSYTISVAAMSLPMGKLADVTSRRRVFLIGIAGFGAFSVLSISAQHLGFLIALRALSGICGAMIFSTNNAILISTYPPEVRGKVIGYSTAATYIGLTAGPVIGGILNSTFGWRSIFAVSACVSVCAFIAGLGAGREESRTVRSASAAGEGTAAGNKKSADMDISGAILYAAAISISLYGMSGLGTGTLPAILFAAGIAGIAAFFVHESRCSDPVMKVSMFRSRTFTFSNLAALLNYGATFAISYTISIYLQVILGMPSSRAGLLLICMPAIQALFSPLTGSLSDRVRPSILASAGMGICAFTLLLFSRIGETTPLAYIITALCLTGVGFALFSSPNTNAILSCVRREDYSVANSIVATMRTYGQSSGMALLSVITSAILGNGTLEDSAPSDILRMMHIAFLTFAVICVIGILFSLARDQRD